jgi:hypothetical protein
MRIGRPIYTMFTAAVTVGAAQAMQVKSPLVLDMYVSLLGYDQEVHQMNTCDPHSGSNSNSGIFKFSRITNFRR